MVSQQPEQDDEQTAFASRAQRLYLDRWIEGASPALIEVARVASLPHFIDLRLLATLIDGGSNLRLLVDRLTRQQILIAVDDRYFIVQPPLRKRFLERWQVDDPASYRAANARAAQFFYARMGDRQDEDLEYVFHLLPVNEGQALQELAYIFEDALTRRLLGRAEELLEYAEEQLPVLSPLARAWIRYFEARLELAHRRYAESEKILIALRTQQDDPYLRGQVLMDLAAIYASTQRWGDALACYDEVETLFLREDDPLQLATLYQAQGATYVQLATALGGLEEGDVTFEPLYRRWRKRIQHAPFLAYRWFSRRINFLPNVYFGTNYQDWYIIRVYHEAIDCYEKARQLLSVQQTAGETAVEPALTDVEIRLADLQHTVGRWKLAEDKFRRLADSPVVRADDYRQAVLKLALGRAALARDEFSAARAHLQHAYDTFREYEDVSSLSIAGRLLALSELASENVDAAVSVYVESGNEARKGNNFLAATQIWWILAHLGDRHQFSEELRSHVATFGESLPQRAYIARFPGNLLNHYRRLAFNFVAPIIFIFVLLLATETVFVILVLEALFSAALGAAAPLVDLAIGLLFVVGLILLTVWGYELIYVVLGWRHARRLPLADLSEQQPKYLLSQPETLSVRDEEGNEHQLRWADVRKFVSIDRAIWREPIDLFSRFALTSTSSSPLIVEGIFRQYAGLKADVATRFGLASDLPPVAELDYSFLRSRWTLVALLLSFIMVYVVITDRLDQTYRSPNIIQLTPAGTDYAYLIGEKGELWVADIGGPGPPENLGMVDFPWRARAITLAGQHLYVAAGSDGLRVLSTRNPARPVEVGFVDTPGSAEDVAVAGQYAYIADGPQGLAVVDVGIPEDLRLVDGLVQAGHATLVAARPGRAYLLDAERGLLILGEGEAGSYVELGRWEGPGRPADHSLQGNFAYLVDEVDGLFVVDVADPAEPGVVAQLPLPELRHIVVAPPFAYLLASTGMLWVVDISNPPTVAEVNHFQTGAPASGLAVAEGVGLAYVGVSGSGLVVLNVLNPEDEIEVRDTLETITPTEIALPPSYPLPLTSVFYQFLRWARFIFPIIGLVRLLANEYRLKQLVHEDARLRDRLPSIVALVILSAWMLLEIVALTR